jgi:hypothetical protein
MVQIPTARDVAYVSPRSGRPTSNGPEPMIGQALQNLGQGLQQAGYNLSDLATREKADLQAKQGFDLETKIAEFRDQEEKNYNEAVQNAKDGGIGFTRQFLEGYQQRTNAFIKDNFSGIDEQRNAASRQTLLGLGNSLYEKANNYEMKAKGDFYDRTTNLNLDKVRTQIANNSAPFDQLKSQGLAAIDSADMPEQWKAARRAAWDSDAAESQWTWDYKQNPQQAINEVRGTTGSLVDKIVGVESGGNPNAKNPNSSAQGAGQFIDSTWLAMMHKYRPDLTEGKSAKEIIALKTDNALSREMTGRYAEENASFLENQGIQATDGNVYLAHFLGPRGAAQVLKADPSAPVSSIVDDGTVSANPFLKGMTAADLRAWSDKKMGSAPSTKYDAIPYDQRQKLADWGQRRYDQDQVQQRAASKDTYRLMIATQPDNVKEDVILHDQTIDNGDKAELINSLHAAMKENAGVQNVIAGVATGRFPVNPFDTTQTAPADKAFDQMAKNAATPQDLGNLTAGYIQATGYIPKKVQADLRRGNVSKNPAEMQQAMQSAEVLERLAPTSFQSFEGSTDVRKNLDLYKSYTDKMGLSPEDASKKIIDLNDPEKVKERDSLLKSETVTKQVKAIDANAVRATFGQWFDPKLGDNPLAESSMVADYKSIYQEALIDAKGDTTVAADLAKTRFQRIYSPSQFYMNGSNIVIKYPPERTYPAGADGTWNYIHDQAVQALKDQGITTDTVFLQPNLQTENDVKSGIAPRYQVLYLDADGKRQWFNIPFYADVDAEKKSGEEQQQKRLNDAEQGMIDNRGQALKDQQFYSDIRKAREDAAKQYQDYPETFRAQKMREAEQSVRDKAMQNEKVGPADTTPIVPNGNLNPSSDTIDQMWNPF